MERDPRVGVRDHASELPCLERLQRLRLDPRPGTPADFAAFMAAESKKWSETINAANIKAD